MDKEIIGINVMGTFEGKDGDDILFKEIETHTVYKLPVGLINQMPKSFNYKVEVTITDLVHKLTNSYGKLFTASYKKKDGSDRTITGSLESTNTSFGRSTVKEIDGTSITYRQVCHRTLYSLIIDGTKYYAKHN